MITRIQIASRLALAAAVLLTLSTTTRAQAPTPDPRWEPWIGCWQPEAPPEIDVATKLPFVCVTPTNVGSAVQIATVENGAVVTLCTSSHSPSGEMASSPVPLRLRPAVHVSSEWRYTRRESADHWARSHPVQPCFETGRCWPFAFNVSRVTTAPFSTVAI